MPRLKWTLIIAAIVLFAIATLLIHRRLRADRLEAQLLRTQADAVLRQPTLVRFAVDTAKPLYATYCASCHGADMAGSPKLGAPNLRDRIWLYDDGTVFAIERTVLYGIRSGVSKSHNVTEMPAFGTRGVLSPDEIGEVVQYVLALSGRPHLAQAARAGRELYAGRGGCGDCHGEDARGNPGYGAPDLTANVWNTSADAQSLYEAIYFGEHHIMPAWFRTLRLGQIRALAVYIYESSHPAEASSAARSPS